MAGMDGCCRTVVDIDAMRSSVTRFMSGGGASMSLSTRATKPLYGDSGWEQFFNSAPQEVRAFSGADPTHGTILTTAPVSPEIALDFPGYCSKSLAHIVFVQNH